MSVYERAHVLYLIRPPTCASACGCPPFTNSGSDCTTCRIYSLASQHSVCPCRLLRVIYSGVTSSFRLHLLPASPPAESRASCARDPRNLGTSHPNKPHTLCTERGKTVARWPSGPLLTSFMDRLLRA